MVRHLKIRYNRLAKTLQFDVFAVILANGNRRIDDVRDNKHPLADFSGELVLFGFQRGKLLRHGADLALGGLRFLFFALRHLLANLFANGIALAAEIVAAGFGFTEFAVKRNNLVHQRKLVLLEFFADIFLNRFRFIAQEFYVQHVLLLLYSFPARRAARSRSSSLL